MAKQYDQSRPNISADIRRAVEIESGHTCAISRCGEHTYLEIHHINQNREDNRVENLILLCDKHHKMSHANTIDRKSLKEYKRKLQENYTTDLRDRIRRLEELLSIGEQLESTASGPGSVKDPDLPIVDSQLTYQKLEELALNRYELIFGVSLTRQVRIARGNSRLALDALVERKPPSEDLVIEVKWLRKRYLDAPIWLQQLEAMRSAYESITGRKAVGLLIYVVPKRTMKELSSLPFTSEQLRVMKKRPEVLIFTYDELGLDAVTVSGGIRFKSEN